MATFPNAGFFILLRALFVLASAVTCSASDRIDAFIAQEMARKKIPGIGLTVLQDGHVTKMQGYGAAILEGSARVDSETGFEIGSITKQFTASLVMMLARERKLEFDDRITRYFAGTPDDWNTITVRHLLTHTSGIPNYTALEGFEAKRHLTPEQFVRALGAHPLKFTPGSRFSYCNSGYNLLGFIIEKVSHEKYWDVLDHRIFGPLKMTASYSRDLPRSGNRAAGYEKQDENLVPRDSNLTDVFAAGAIVSSIQDLTKWARAIDAGAILSQRELGQMWSPIRLNDGSTYPYGFGWRLDNYQGRKNIGHSGSTSGFSASLQRFPDERLTVIVLCNLGEEGVATGLARQVALMVESPTESPEKE
jgi:CubicO group peptidase (beta-lactamase class C family)